MKGTLDVHQRLLAADVPHEIIRLPHIVLNVDEIPDALGVEPEQCIAVRAYDVDGEFVALLVPVSAQVDQDAVLELQHGHTIRPTADDRVNAVTDFAAGLVPPLPLPPDITVLADPAVTSAEIVYTATGDAGTALGIPADVLVKAAGAHLAHIAVRPVPALGAAS